MCVVIRVRTGKCLAALKISHSLCLLFVYFTFAIRNLANVKGVTFTWKNERCNNKCVHLRQIKHTLCHRHTRTHREETTTCIMRTVGHVADAEISVVTDRGTYLNSPDLKTHKFQFQQRNRKKNK